MRRRLGIALAVLGVAAAAAVVWLYGLVTDLEVEKIGDDLHVIYGLGSNVAVLRTGDGAVVVDSMALRMQGERIRELAESLTGEPVVALLNTHYHLDHTHGNPGFAPGTRVVATQRTLEHLRSRDADYWEGDAASTLPNETFTDVHELVIGRKTIRATHVGRGHTDGDLVVLFVEDRTLHAGDLFFNGRYPNIDLEAGGSVREWDASLERALAQDFDRVIPGHGPATDRAGLASFQRFVRELWSVAEESVARGLTLEQTLADVKLTQDAGFEVIAIPFVTRLDRDFVVRRAYEEASGAR
jgi:glyoxylase-like metal-dependent hydrolase (beta-lactamase superfamily II)